MKPPEPLCDGLTYSVGAVELGRSNRERTEPSGRAFYQHGFLGQASRLTKRDGRGRRIAAGTAIY
jgi:hypothetical protein